MYLRNILIILTILLSACEAKLPSPFKAEDVSAKYAQANFHLQDSQGVARSLADYRGKVVALFFGYVHCPQICPTTLADLNQVYGLLGSDAAKLQVIFVTVDPERDNAALLGQYVPAFNSSFIGLWGDQKATDEAARNFGVFYQKQSSESGAYDVDHSAATYLISPDGKHVLQAPYQQKTEWMLQDIRLLLAMSR
jgi:protein SCO1/2